MCSCISMAYSSAPHKRRLTGSSRAEKLYFLPRVVSTRADAESRLVERCLTEPTGLDTSTLLRVYDPVVLSKAALYLGDAV